MAVKRIFRADTPHDILSAILVAQTLSEGENYLAFSTDYSDKSQEMTESMTNVAGLFNWTKVFNISKLPINDFWQDNKSIGQWQRLRSIPKSVKKLKEIIPQNLFEQIDEIYVNCFHHGDVHIFIKLFEQAKCIYYPHGFDSLHFGEIDYYRQYTTTAEIVPTKLFKRKLTNMGKRIVFGKDSVIPPVFKIDAAYTFNVKFPHLEEQTDLSANLNGQNLRRLYENLQGDVRDYYEGLRTRCSSNTLLLLLYVSDYYPEYPAELELDGYVQLINRLEKKAQFDSVLIKPHPLNKPQWLARVQRHLETNLPEKHFVFIEKYRYLPIEFIASAFDFSICTGLGSSSIRTLRKIYNVPTYFTGDLVTRLFYNHPYHLKVAENWADEMRQEIPEV